jgi:hypothetical protein
MEHVLCVTTRIHNEEPNKWETEREINNNHKSVRVVLLPNSMSEYDKSGWQSSFIVYVQGGNEAWE